MNTLRRIIISIIKIYGVMWFIVGLIMAIYVFVDAQNILSFIEKIILSLLSLSIGGIGLLPLKIQVNSKNRKSVPFPKMTPSGEFAKQRSGDNSDYIVQGNTTERADGKPISDEDIPYLMQISYEEAIKREKNSPNPKFHRTGKEKNLSFNFLQRYKNEIRRLERTFPETYRNAYSMKDLSQQLEAYELALTQFEQAKRFCYGKGIGGKVYFQDMWEHLHNSQNDCYSFRDMITDNIAIIKRRQDLIPTVLDIISKNDGILQKDIYDKIDAPKDIIQSLIKELDLQGGIARIRKGHSYELHNKVNNVAVVECLTSRENANFANDFLSVHKDLISLCWIANGPNKNYDPREEDKSSNNFSFGGYTINISILGSAEPSALYMDYPIEKPYDGEVVDRPPYYPRYTELTPKQRYLYWQFLKNPYDKGNDIGYVFIFYYGLERHLIHGDFEKSFDLILKLRDIYTNNSFQAYSASALVLSCLIKKRTAYLYKFIDALDSGDISTISENLFFVCKLGIGEPLHPAELMLMYRSFDFTNTRYIKMHPTIFIDKLGEALKHHLGHDYIDLSDYQSIANDLKVSSENIPTFANVSLIDNTVSIPNLLANKSFKTFIFSMLCQTHEDVKQFLADQRKNK